MLSGPNDIVAKRINPCALHKTYSQCAILPIAYNRSSEYNAEMSIRGIRRISLKTRISLRTHIRIVVDTSIEACVDHVPPVQPESGFHFLDVLRTNVSASQHPVSERRGSYRAVNKYLLRDPTGTTRTVLGTHPVQP